MKKLFVLLFSTLCIIINAQTVRVATAGNLRFVIEEIKVLYTNKNPESKIIINLGSSGALFQQISNGANFDLFMAADKSYPDRLKEQGITTADVKTYVFGKLALWSNTIDVSKGINILTDKSVKRIAIAKPEVAPYGARAVECLKYYKIYDQVKDKLVYADNIAQAAQFAQTGNAEVGMLAMALLMTPEMKGSKFEIDTKSYHPVEQALILLKSGQENPEAIKFMNFILGPECKSIFEKYGYLVP